MKSGFGHRRFLWWTNSHTDPLILIHWPCRVAIGSAAPPVKCLCSQDWGQHRPHSGSHDPLQLAKDNWVKLFGITMVFRQSQQDCIWAFSTTREHDSEKQSLWGTPETVYGQVTNHPTCSVRVDGWSDLTPSQHSHLSLCFPDLWELSDLSKDCMRLEELHKVNTYAFPVFFCT